MVCGSIGYGGINEIKNMYTFLVNHGFSIIDHIVHKGMDYSHITDFRDKQDLSSKIVQHDLKYIILNVYGRELAIARFASPFLAFDLFVVERFHQIGYTSLC